MRAAGIIGVALLFWLPSCGGEGSGTPSTGASAPQQSSAAPSAVPSAEPSAAPAVTHEPGTVPPAATHHPSEPPKEPLPPPVRTRLPAQKSRKSPSLSVRGFPAKGPLLELASREAILFIDVTTGAGYSINEAEVEYLAFSPDDSRLAIAGNGRVTLWDTAKGTLLHTFPGATSALSFSHDGKRLAVGRELPPDNGGLVIYDVEKGTELKQIKGYSMPFQIELSKSGKEVAVQFLNISVEVYSTETGTKIGNGGGAETGGTFSFIISPDGRYAAASAPGGHGMVASEISGWSPRTLITVDDCKEHIWPFFSKSGTLLFGKGGNKFIKGFETATWKPYASYHAPAGRWVVSSANDLSKVVVTQAETMSRAVVVTVETGAEVPLERAFVGTSEMTPSYEISPDGKYVVGSGGDSLLVWSAKTGKVEYEQSPQ